MRIPLALALIATLAAPAGAQTLGWALLPAMEGMDLDGDGVFSPSEIGGTRVPLEFDTDGDGMLHIAELTAGFWGLYDADRNGLLTDDELQAMRGLAAAGVYDLGL